MQRERERETETRNFVWDAHFVFKCHETNPINQTHLLDITADVVHHQVMLLSNPRRRLAREPRASRVLDHKVGAALGPVCMCC
jgi:hypothetical protein